MAGLNKVMVIGNLGADPLQTTRRLQSGANRRTSWGSSESSRRQFPPEPGSLSTRR